MGLDVVFAVPAGLLGGAAAAPPPGTEPRAAWMRGTADERDAGFREFANVETYDHIVIPHAPIVIAELETLLESAECQELVRERYTAC